MLRVAARTSRPRVAAALPGYRAAVAAMAVAATILFGAPALALAGPDGSLGAEPPSQPQGTKTVRPAIVGGSQIQVTSAPWQVAILGASGSLCGGSIVDATHVVSAAHCFYDAANARIPAGQFTVRAGASNLSAAEPGDDVQTRAVGAITIHPNYVSPGGAGGTLAQFANDVAVLTVPALDLARPTAATRPVALPPGGLNPLAGTPLSVTGFGLQTPGAANPDGNLHGLNTLALDGAYASGPLNAIYVTTQSPNGSFCQGDSGGGLTTVGVLVGIVSNNPGCGANEVVNYTSVSAQENLQFIRNVVSGTAVPLPAAPRGGDDVSLFGPLSPQVGEVFTCRPGTWSNGPSFTYAFTDSRDGAVLANGPSPTYTLVATDVGRSISCRATATTAGGVGQTAPTQGSAAVRAAPLPTPTPAPAPTPGPAASPLSVSVSRGATSVRRGRAVGLRVTIRNRGTAAAGSLRTCVSVSSRFSVTARGGASLKRGRLCWSNRSLKSKTTKRFTLRAGRRAKTGAVSQKVTASATGITAASSSFRLTIRR